MPPHDYKKFPELSNKQIEEMPFDSPHKQITEDFDATIVKVHDGDTITLRVSFRKFVFPLRLLDIDAPEMNAGGEVARDWLRGRLLNEEVKILINIKNRVDKYGRLLGHVFHRGLDTGQEMLHLGLVKPYGRRTEGTLPDMNKELNIKKWL